MTPIKGFENYLVDEAGTVVNETSGQVLTASLNENGYLYVSFWKDGKQHTKTVHRLVAQAYVPNPENKPIVNHLDADRSNPHASNLEWCTQSENIKHTYQIGNRSAKKHFTPEELDWLLNRFISGVTMTELAASMKVGLSRLTINLRGQAVKRGKLTLFNQELSRQKTLRNTEANSNKRKPVLQMDLEGNRIAEFPSATAAARALGRSSSGSISNALNPSHQQEAAFGYLWIYS